MRRTVRPNTGVVKWQGGAAMQGALCEQEYPTGIL